MKIPRIRTLAIIVAGAIGALSIACDADLPAPSPAPADESQPAASASTSSDEASERQGYDSNTVMYRLFSGFATTVRDKQEAALREVEERNDTSQIPVLIESMRYLSSRESREAAAATLRQLTGQPFDSDQWFEWMEWYGKHRDEFRPPEDYLDWKIGFMSQVDPRFKQFLTPAKVFSEIDLTEVVWGGVIPDGIPDLKNPPAIPAAAADYLGDGERVFGVTINGQSRAYPLRIINAHEMVNDTLGGEPFALSW